MADTTIAADDLAVMILAHAETAESRGMTATPANLRWIAEQVAQLGTTTAAPVGAADKRVAFIIEHRPRRGRKR